MDDRYYTEVQSVMEAVKQVVIGKDQCVSQVMAAILAGGHILIDDIPGVGKTTMAMAFARALGLDNKRMQFTPDVMPSDILGFAMYHQEGGSFSYQPGAIMCNLFLADEINRTSPKTQSALLEVMEENSVTVDGVTRQVPDPFVVIATENPVGSVGTQLLPESQLDRFMICITMGYPSLEHEVEIARGKSESADPSQIESVIQAEELSVLKEQVDQVHVHDAVYMYIVKLVQATRQHAMIELGVSPRGTIALSRMAKANAFLHRREYVTPEDVMNVFDAVVSHRIVLNSKARVSHAAIGDILGQIKGSVKAPSARKG